MLLLCSLSVGNTVSAATKVGKVSGIVAVSKTKKQIQVKFKKIKNAKYRIAIKANGNAKAVSPKTTPKKIKVYAENNKIYAMDSWAEKYISIPNSMPVKTKIVVEGAKKVSFVTETGDILKVSSKGVVEPKVTKYYWSGNVGTTVYNPNADRVTTQYDYSPYASSASAMIIMNGGDCWASTDAIIALCNKVGIKAHSRNANRDAGAGHRQIKFNYIAGKCSS